MDVLLLPQQSTGNLWQIEIFCAFLVESGKLDGLVRAFRDQVDAFAEPRFWIGKIVNELAKAFFDGWLQLFFAVGNG